MDNILEKYRDAVEEYAAYMQKQTVELLKDFDLTQSEIDEFYSRYKTEMIKSLGNNEPYAQLFVDLVHCKILENNLYSLTHIAKSINSDSSGLYYSELATEQEYVGVVTLLGVGIQ